jgi:NAD-reducing hydrogenase large subunit
MARQITIEPVTRIEGHAKITIMLDDMDQVTDARFHVTEFRGFERFVEGRPFWEMAGITARTCGICPVSHLMASAKAGDAILAVTIPPAAEKLRRLMNNGQFVQSHALSFFHLSAPDLILGFDSDPAKRNVFGLIAANPELARKGIRLRQFGQEIIELLGGKKIHPAWTAPGGVRTALTEDGRQHIRAGLPEALATAQLALQLFKDLALKYKEEAISFGNFHTLFMSLVADDGSWENYGGKLRFVDSSLNIVADGIEARQYKDYIGEAVEPWSYMKFPYFKPQGYPHGIYRVGPLARLSVCEKMGSPLADRELTEFRQRDASVQNSSFYYHYARLIEIIACLEQIDKLIDDPDILSKRLRAEAGVNVLDAVGVSEAPRGTLFHHYQVDEHGLMKKANLIIATGQNNLAMNRMMGQIARHFITGPKIPEGVLNRMEAGIRAFDPCLSCATHAAGQMPLKITLQRASGQILDVRTRD